MTNNAFKKWVLNFRETLNLKFFFISGALFEYSVILLRMKIKTIRQIRKCLNGNLAAYLAPLANPLGSNVANGGISRPTQGYQGREIRHFFSLSSFFCRRNKFSCLRPYLKGGSGISVLFSLSFLDIFNRLCNSILLLRVRVYVDDLWYIHI